MTQEHHQYCAALTETAIHADTCYSRLLERIHSKRNGSYHIYTPDEFPTLERMLASGELSELDAHSLRRSLRAQPQYITEFESHGVRDYRPGVVSIAEWADTIHYNELSFAVFWGATRLQAMLAALYAYERQAFQFPGLHWDTQADPFFDRIMTILMRIDVIEVGLDSAGYYVEAIDTEPLGGSQGFQLFCNTASILMTHCALTLDEATELVERGYETIWPGLEHYRDDPETIATAFLMLRSELAA